MVAICFLPSSWSKSRNAHIAVEVVTRPLPETIHKVLHFLAALLFAVFTWRALMPLDPLHPPGHYRPGADQPAFRGRGRGRVHEHPDHAGEAHHVLRRNETGRPRDAPDMQCDLCDGHRCQHAEPVHGLFGLTLFGPGLLSHLHSLVIAMRYLSVKSKRAWMRRQFRGVSFECQLVPSRSVNLRVYSQKPLMYVKRRSRLKNNGIPRDRV